jgi:hypothetical protein
MYLSFCIVQPCCPLRWEPRGSLKRLDSRGFPEILYMTALSNCRNRCNVEAADLRRSTKLVFNANLHPLPRRTNHISFHAGYRERLWPANQRQALLCLSAFCDARKSMALVRKQSALACVSERRVGEDASLRQCVSSASRFRRPERSAPNV